MHWLTWMALGAGCGGPATDDAVDTPVTDTDTDPDTDVPFEDTQPAVDTALARFSVVGAASVGATYAGTEAVQFDDFQSGSLLCRFVWQARDWDSDPAATGTDPISRECVDPGGAPCTWDFTVNLSGGALDSGDRCADFGFEGTDVAGESVGWGFHLDYLGTGPTTMYYDAEFGGGWLSTATGTFTPSDGSFTYEVLQGYRAYVP